MPDLFQQALQHHQQGELQQAAELYQQVLAQQPEHADALHLLGVVLHQAGQHERAVPLIREAIRLSPNNTIYYCNLSNVHRSLGQWPDALQCCDRALQMEPGKFEALLNKGLVLLSSRRFADAEKILRESIQRQPNDPRGHTYLGECLTKMGRVREAIAAFDAAIQCNAQHALAHTGRGLALLAIGDPQAALPHLRRAVDLQPQSATTLANLARGFGDLDRMREALALFEDAMQINPNVPEICLHIGYAWLKDGDPDEAEGWFRRVTNLQRSSPEGLTGLADVLAARGQPEQALAQYQQVLQSEPGCVAAFDGMAAAYGDIGDVAGAVVCLQKLTTLQPECADRFARLGERLDEAGVPDAAAANYRLALERDPKCEVALAGLATLQKERLPDELRARMEELLPNEVRLDRKAALAFGLARVHDARDQFSVTAAYLQQANAWRKEWQRRRKKSYDRDAHSKTIDATIQAFSPEFFAKNRDGGNDSNRPVFVVGMPWSGATLVEKILTGHPQAFGAGSRRFLAQAFHYLPHVMSDDKPALECLARMSPAVARSCATWYLEQLDRLEAARALRVIDRSAENYIHVGFIVAMFPNARIIHCRRDPRDLALANFMSNDESTLWANDFEEIGRRFLDYHRLMAHWWRVAPGKLLEIDCEAILHDQERASRQLVAWLGLPWSQKCSEVSLAQQPIQRSSIGRWRQYESLLQPFSQLMPAEALQN